MSSACECEYIQEDLRPLAMPIEQIRQDPQNVRKHPEENLKAIQSSLEAFGQQKPIVIDADNICLAGNGTLQAASALGWTHLAVVRSSLGGLRARAFAIADNRTTDTSNWDEALLAEQLARLQNDLDFDHQAAGFSDSQIQDLIDKAVGLTKSEEPPEVNINPLYQVLVECSGESQQEQLYEKLNKEGYTCRVLTL